MNFANYLSVLAGANVKPFFKLTTKKLMFFKVYFLHYFSELFTNTYPY